MPLSKEERILAAADALFARYGLRKTSIDEIARDAQIGKGTIYSYFQSKEAIFLSVQRRHVASSLQRLRAAAESKRQPRQRLKSYLQARLELVVEHARQQPVDFDIFAEVRAQPEYMAVKDDLDRGEVTLLREIFQAGVEAGEFRSTDHEATIWLLQKLIGGISVDAYIRGDTLVAERAEDICRVLLAGLSLRTS